jgi:glutamine amidotransferase
MGKADAVLIDAGTGNLHSVYHALTSLDFNILVTSSPADLDKGRRIILPGVGAFGNFMAGLQERSLIQPLCQAVEQGQLLLGICVGMQALFETSAELGTHAGLGLLPGRVVHFPPLGPLKIPQTGWNQLWPESQPPTPLLEGLAPGPYAYFNHSFYCDPARLEDICASTDYGISFASMVHHDNLFGVQFHPEKSQRVGLQILANFMRL